MTHREPNIMVKVDLTNPGQFFACCGLLELADRLWPGAEGWFDANEFCMSCEESIEQLLTAINDASLIQLNPNDDMSSPMSLSSPFDLQLNWWLDEGEFGKDLKVWAGSMRCVRIARAMKQVISMAPASQSLFDFAAVVFDPDDAKKKVEPYYFDSRRGANAQSLDIGFAPDSLKIKTLAYPAVEFLSLVGLQRSRPAATKRRRVFDYYPWTEPLPVCIVPAATCGVIRVRPSHGYRFENSFRTEQKKHKSFLPANPIGVSR